jgi:hypothetical protein
MKETSSLKNLASYRKKVRRYSRDRNCRMIEKRDLEGLLTLFRGTTVVQYKLVKDHMVHRDL